jgi:hypothetical protein
MTTIPTNSTQSSTESHDNVKVKILQKEVQLLVNIGTII